MLIEQIKRGTRIQQYETVRTRKDGSSLHVSLTVSPITNILGIVTAVSTIARYRASDTRTASSAAASAMERWRAVLSEEGPSLIAERSRAGILAGADPRPRG